MKNKKKKKVPRLSSGVERGPKRTKRLRYGLMQTTPRKLPALNVIFTNFILFMQENYSLKILLSIPSEDGGPITLCLYTAPFA